jgi:hypothetical protein
MTSCFMLPRKQKSRAKVKETLLATLVTDMEMDPGQLRVQGPFCRIQVFEQGEWPVQVG